MKVLVFDPDHRGHHLQFVRILADVLAGAKFEAVAHVAKNALQLPEGKAHLVGLNNEVKLDQTLESPPLSSALKNSKVRLNQLIDSVHRHRPDHVFLPYGDGIVQLLGFGMSAKALKDVSIEALILKGGGAGSLKKKLISKIYHRLYQRSKCERIHFLNPLSYNPVRHAKDRFGIMPEPVEPFTNLDVNLARKQLSIESAGRIISCLGGISAQKNVQILTQAFLKSNCSVDDRLLLVGKQSPEIVSFIGQLSADSKSRIIEINQYVDNETFLNAIVASDVVTIPYKSQAASSGILVRAISAGKTIITDEAGYLGWLTKNFRFGSTCDVASVDSFANAISNQMAGDLSSDCEAQQRFREFHTQDNFGRTWLQYLRSHSTNETSDQFPVTWEWVTEGLKARD